MASRRNRIAVIGAGPAGAIAVDALVKEDAFQTVRVFERRPLAGGTWVFAREEAPKIPSLRALLEGRADAPVAVPTCFPSETPRVDNINSQRLRYADSGAHEHLHSNLPPEIMCFSQEPLPDTLSDRTREQFGPNSPFRHREVMQKWVEDIIARGGHSHLVEFNTTVELAEKQGEEWVLTLRKSTPDSVHNIWWQERFDAVVVATGHFYVPFIPKIPGLAEYDEKFPGRIQHSKHYQLAEDYRDKRVVVVGGSISAFDAVHDVRTVSKLPVISSMRNPSPVFTAAPFIHPHIDNRPEIAAFEPDTGRVIFVDGSHVDDVDIVLFATGYAFSFPFLPDIKPKNGRIPGLYHHVFCMEDPSLAFLGMVTGAFGLRIFEWQAVAAARLFAGRAALPSNPAMKAWEQDRLADRGDGPAFSALSPDFERYYEDLRLFAGDPAPGTRGRQLPKYRAEWGESLWKFVDYRIRLWQKAASEAWALRKSGTP